MFNFAQFEKSISSKSIMMTIVIGLLFLMGIALWIDGQFGERVFGMLLASFGLILGYFFRKAQK